MISGLNPYICVRCARNIARNVSSVRNLSSKINIQNRRYSTKQVAQDGRPFRMAVIGSGPAGFYTAYKVMSKIDNAVVDMYEHLPVPFGLVRFGVAPDHPEVKKCQDKFREVAESPNFNFIGNIAVGTNPGELPLSTVVPHYDAVLFAYGASKDRTLGIEGEENLKGVYSARAFVGWYNGLPEYSNLAPDLTLGEEAVVIGQGNVALDVARILLSDLSTLRKTDITEAAIEALSRSRVNRVRVVGRRGPMQAAFTIKEVRELMKLPSVSFDPIEAELLPPDISKLPRASKRIMQVLEKGSGTTPSSAAKSWSLDFRLSPSKFNGDSLGSLKSVSFQRTSLEPDVFDPYAKTSYTGESVDLQANLAFRSIGYKSEALKGLSELGVPFDDRLGIIPNDQYGRVMQPTKDPGDPFPARHVPGMYSAGWVKRGPTGVIASTMNDAFATADAIADDWHSHALFIESRAGEARKLGWDGVKGEAVKTGLRRVSWQDWEKIDEAEMERGKAKGKEREKFTTVADMLRILD